MDWLIDVAMFVYMVFRDWCLSGSIERAGIWTDAAGYV